MVPAMINKDRFSTNDVLSLLCFVIFVASAFFSLSGPALLVAALVLALAIACSVHNAEVIADRVGPSLGTLILALSVTIIEVALIVSLMSQGGPEASTIARDTVFAALMIVTNGIIGVCILLGGIRHKELSFQAIGTTSLLGTLATLSALTLVLPNFTTSTPGPTYGTGQLVFASVASLFLYGALVWGQTRSHRAFFETPLAEETDPAPTPALRPSASRAWLSFLGLLLSLIAVVGLAKLLSPAIGQTLAAMGAPTAAVGIVVALLVLAPETLAAINAAKTNQLQTSLNLALGSGAASIALTIPVVGLFSILSDQPLTLGLDSKGLVFLVATFTAGSLTFAQGKTTALHGIVHLVIMAAYLAISFMP